MRILLDHNILDMNKLKGLTSFWWPMIMPT